MWALVVLLVVLVGGPLCTPHRGQRWFVCRTEISSRLSDTVVGVAVAVRLRNQPLNMDAVPNIYFWRHVSELVVEGGKFTWCRLRGVQHVPSSSGATAVRTTGSADYGSTSASAKRGDSKSSSPSSKSSKEKGKKKGRDKDKAKDKTDGTKSRSRRKSEAVTSSKAKKDKEKEKRKVSTFPFRSAATLCLRPCWLTKFRSRARRQRSVASPHQP